MAYYPSIPQKRISVLLKFDKDKGRWIHWLFEAKKESWGRATASN
jgi:hypothetical protein